ncbi:uncharacterized protein LOC129872558 [Solanum dulcamara]|uniref:uncharacterized protein LOC129872558 n=1 Tax=Solanum dulcamara TaxID=45834 RepID=UPI0024851741|nr:uncharacterized protein LOC129872558 [Solanum dulcamara]
MAEGETRENKFEGDVEAGEEQKWAKQEEDTQTESSGISPLNPILAQQIMAFLSGLREAKQWWRAYVECCSLVLPPLTWAQLYALILEKYVPRTLRERKKDEFMALEQGELSVAAYEFKFHVLPRYATQLVLSVHMTSFGRSFNEVTDFVKKVESVRKDGQAKILAKRPKNAYDFQSSYSRGSDRPVIAARPIQLTLPTFISSFACTPQQHQSYEGQGA